MTIRRRKCEQSDETYRTHAKYDIHDDDADYNNPVKLFLAATTAPVCFHDAYFFPSRLLRRKSTTLRRKFTAVLTLQMRVCVLNFRFHFF